MDMLSFYWPNLIAGFCLSLALGLIGIHTIARNQALDSFVLGQELQSGIIFSAFLLNVFDMHVDHGLHSESLISLVIAITLHLSFIWMLKKYNLIRLEVSLVYVFFLIAINNLFMSLNPMIESHMVNSMLGDIVTASKIESILISLFSALFVLFYIKQRKVFLKESIDIALFSEEKQKISHQIILVLFMSLSVHILGLVFTLSMLLMAPIFMLLTHMKNLNYSIFYVLLFNGLSVLIGFSGLGLNDRIPTSVMIIMVLTMVNLLFFFSKRILK
mgnify:CR=1 FL=1